MAELILMLKGQEIRRVPLVKEEMTIGRDPANDLPIDNPGVSRFHARIVGQDGRFYCLDDGSSNGIFVNGQRVNQIELREGSEIQVAKYRLIFTYEDSGKASLVSSDAGGFNVSEKTMLYRSNDLNKILDTDPSQGPATPFSAPMAGFAVAKKNQEAVQEKASSKKTLALLIIATILLLTLFAVVILLSR